MLPLVPVACAPTLFDGARFPGEILVRGRDSALRELVLVNWRDDEAVAPVIRPGEIAGRSADRYLVVEYDSGRWQIVSPEEEIALPPIPPHGAEIVRVTPYDGEKPYVVGSDAHFALGEELDELRMDGDELVFAVNYRFPVPSEYRVLLPESRANESGQRVVIFRPDQPGLYRRVVKTRPSEC